jgi:hypothetical protein
LLNAGLTLPVFGRYSRAAKAARDAFTRDTKLGESFKAAGETLIWQNQSRMVGVMAVLLVADLLGLACWACLAVAARRGHGWTRVAGAVLLAIYSFATLLVVFHAQNDASVEFTTLVVWAIGVATVIPLWWSQQAREFFSTWRKQ